MTFKNRVNPFGTLHAVPVRGEFMGNRGILHDEGRNVVKTHAHQNWVCCTLSWKDVQRKPLSPGRYTELFFLDEATALSAGHRPCATCRRDRYREFTRIWEAVHGGASDGRSLPQTIDGRLHKARISRRGAKVTHLAEAVSLPDGAIFAAADQAVLAWKGEGFAWSFEGYTPCGLLPAEPVAVLTPEPLIGVLAGGYRPEMHDSLSNAPA